MNGLVNGDDVLKTKLKIRWITFLNHGSIGSTMNHKTNKLINV